MVGDVAEVAAETWIGLELAALHRLERGEQRVQRAVELVDLRLQEVDPLREVVMAGEDRLLDLLDLALQGLDGGQVVVDHHVENAPDDRGRADLEQLGMLLDPDARANRVSSGAVPHGDHEPDADEDVDLSELDRAISVVVACGLVDDQVESVVALDLGPLVGGARVFHRELVQAEVPADLGHDLVAGLLQLDPDVVAAPARGRRSLFQRHPLVRLASSVAVVGAVDAHGAPPRSVVSRNVNPDNVVRSGRCALVQRTRSSLEMHTF